MNRIITEEEYAIAAGIDEAGRGALAGPVYAACVYVPEDFNVSLLNDSKKMSEQKREYSRGFIEKSCIFGIGSASEKEIDLLNILQATFLAMERAFRVFREMAEEKELNTNNITVIVDGNMLPNFLSNASMLNIKTAISKIKADSIVPSVMAASILAKTERDRFMNKMDSLYPGYGYAKHKGYGTQAHARAIYDLGVSPIQRATFSIPKLKA